MSQNVFDQIDPAIVDGIDLSDILDDFKDALMSGLKGPTRPTQTTAGGGWIDDSQETSNNVLIYKVYTGTTDVSIFTINKATNTVSIPGSDNFFEISKVSEDSVGAVLSLFKKRSIGLGGVKSGDVIGDIQLNSQANDGIKYLVGRIRYIAGEDATSAVHGGYYIIEGTRIGQGTLAEFFRIVDGRLGIGLTTNPTHALHIRSQTGVKNERTTDDSTGPKLVRRKSRVASMGQVQNADEISSDDWNSTDSAGAEFTGARIQVTAEEAHTAVARGMKLSLSIIPKGTSTLVEVFNISEGKVNWGMTTVQDSLEKKTQEFAAVAEVTAFDAQKSFIEVTGVTAMTLKGILAASKSKSFVLYNGTNQNITIVNQSPDVTATDRIAVNGESSFTLQPGKSVEFVRRASISRWVPLVEGNTGITYNEATMLQARMVARTWLEEGYPTSSGATTLGGLYMVKATPTAVYIFGTKQDSSSCAMQVIDRVRGINLVNMPDLFTWRDADTSDDLVPGSIGGYFIMAVRDSQTQRSFFNSLAGGISPAAINNSSSWNGIVQIGDNTWVAVAYGGTYRVGKYVYSTNTWTYISPTTIDVPLRGVTYGDSKIVAVGGPVPGGSSNHACWVSSDSGATWNSYAMPDESTVTYNRVRYLNGIFVAIGGNPATGVSILTSSDGTSWSPVFTSDPGVNIFDVSWSGGLYLAITGLQSAIISTDGVNWISVDSIALGSITNDGRKFFATSYATSVYFYKSLAPSF